MASALLVDRCGRRPLLLGGAAATAAALALGAYVCASPTTSTPLLLSSLLAVAYIWRVVEVAYFKAPADDSRVEAPLGMLLPTWAMIIASIVFGIWTAPIVHLASNAAQNLLGGH